jgi:uncharacterized tellurite resistance protein B-like protein
MLASLKTLFNDLTGDDKQGDRFAENDYRVAAAALLVHAASIDGVVSPAERERLHDVLKLRFGLGDVDTDELIAQATAAEREAVDLYRFTSSLNRSLDEGQRRHLVEMLWKIIYADGRVSEFEDNLVWRSADLLGVSSRDRLEMRRRVAGET